MGLLPVAIVLSSCAGLQEVPLKELAASAKVSAKIVAGGLTRPVDYRANPKDPSLAYVIEKAGIVKLIKNDVLQSTPVLDISSQVNNVGETGFLGIAFDPNFASNNYVYFYYHIPSPLRLVVVRYEMNSDGTALSNPYRIMTFEQPTTSHQGGSINFGGDGYLYMATGDGASPEDVANRAQSGNSLHGKVLRIDPSADGFPTDPDQNYAIPATNPYATSTTIRPEIWAVGLRNPFRWTYDKVTGGFLIADVGQDRMEEINFLPAGQGSHNFGWRHREGTVSFFTDQPAFSPYFKEPFLAYEQTVGRSVVAGFIYRGSKLDPAFKDRMFLGDAVTKKVMSIPMEVSLTTGARTIPVSYIVDHSPDINTALGTEVLSGVVSVVPDSAGEPIVVDMYRGQIVRLVPPTPAP
jgi:glucose/arabinose dehydrogenase